jgi:hypothetical protein
MGLLTNALFVINGDDKAKVMKGLSSENGAKLPRRFFYGRCRRRIPKPSELAARLQSVIEIGRKLKTADGGALFGSGKRGTEVTHKSVKGIAQTLTATMPCCSHALLQLLIHP